MQTQNYIKFSTFSEAIIVHVDGMFWESWIENSDTKGPYLPILHEMSCMLDNYKLPFDVIYSIMVAILSSKIINKVTGTQVHWMEPNKLISYYESFSLHAWEWFLG